MDDIEAIRRLKARYFRTMDAKDWDGMRQVFTDDVVIDTTESGGGVVSGADDVPDVPARGARRRGHRPPGPHARDRPHLGHHGHRDLGPQRHRDLAQRHRLDGYGHYHETYEKGADGWRIKTSTLTRLHADFVIPEPG